MSVIETSQLMLYKEKNRSLFSDPQKHINTVCGRNVELLNVKLAVHIVTARLETIRRGADQNIY